MPLAGLVLLGACSGGGDDDGDGDGARATTTTAANAATTDGTNGSDGDDGDGQSSRPPKLRARLVAEFDQPVMLAPVPGREPSFYVVEKAGRVRLLTGGRPGDVVLDITSDVSSGGERGLLGLAVSPAGQHVYLDYTDREGDTRLVEYALASDSNDIDDSSRREILNVDQPYPNHNGGHLAFGRDGYLYFGLGDGGSGGDPEENAQNLGTLLGKILRIDPDPAGGGVYAIPVDNPFLSRDGARPEIWAYGLRNPWRFSFDRSTGQLWIGDVGQNQREEVSRSPLRSRGGENYGWDRYEGKRRFEGDALPDHVGPVYDYARDDGACAVTGGYVYRGNAIPSLRGWYVFGDFCRGEVVALPADAPEDAPGDPVELGPTVASLASFAEDATGELYALSLQGGVYQLVAAS
ncbi:MAG TPA: PQQ-dependent sugar dehydrogenase [Acidimicrobiales bacterium]